MPRSKTLRNITSWGDKKIVAFKLFLKGKTLSSLDDIEATQGNAFGALYIFKKLAEEMGIAHVVDKKRLPCILLLLIGRILTQGSRLKLLEWSKNQEVEEVLGISPKKLTTDA